MRSSFLIIYICLASVGSSAESSWVETNAGQLPQLSPLVLKKAVPVPAIRNPLRTTSVAATSTFQTAATSAGKGSESAKLRTILLSRVRSVIRGLSPLIAIDNRFYRVGDEILIGESGKPSSAVPPLQGAKVTLTKVGDNDLTFSVHILDTEALTPWQNEVVVPLPNFLKKQ